MLMLFLIGVLGLLVGSFLNVVIVRLHAGKQFVKGRSECPRCKHPLASGELVPLISWVMQRGRCRHCKKPISVQYPLVELVTAALFVVSYLQLELNTFSNLIFFGIWLYILSSMVILAVYDIRWYLLPDKVLLPLIVPAVAMAITHAVMAQSVQPLIGSVAAAVLFGGFFYSLAAVSGGKWMGGGDIKLAFVMGLLLGLQNTALAMLIAFNTAAVIGLLLIWFKVKKRTEHIPFGPFLIAGTVVAYLYGAEIIGWYMQVSGFSILLPQYP